MGMSLNSGGKNTPVSDMKIYALFPLRVDNEIIFENKKLRGLGGVPPAFCFAIASAKARCIFLQRGMPM